MTAKKRGRIIIGWRQVVPPKTRAPKSKLVPVPGAKPAPKTAIADPAGPAEEHLAKDV